MLEPLAVKSHLPAYGALSWSPGSRTFSVMETLPSFLRWAAMAKDDDLSIIKQPGFWIALTVGIAPILLYAAVILYWAAR